MSVHPSVCLSVGLHVRRSVSLPGCLSICMASLLVQASGCLRSSSKTMPRQVPGPRTPGPRKRPAAAEPSSRPKAKRSSAAAAACVRSAWSVSGATTLASLRDEIAKSTGADGHDKIAVASLSAEVSSVLGVNFPNLTYVAAVVGKRGEAVPQLVSRAVGAKHVFEVGESMCLRHGRRCSLSECPPVDMLVVDSVVDPKMLATTTSFVQPRVVAVLAADACVLDDGLKTALGSGWEVSSVIKGAGSLGLPLRGEIAFHLLRRAGAADPAQFLGSFQAATVVPMENLLKSVEPSLEKGWDLLRLRRGRHPSQ